jgi:hypothetical protein
VVALEMYAREKLRQRMNEEFIFLISNQTKRPPGNWAVSSFQGRIVPTEVRINPSELSGEILWVPERQCQGISPQ